MKKPHGRKTRQRVTKILSTHMRADALTLLAQIPDEQLVGHLFSHFYHQDPLIKFRSITAMGQLGKRVAHRHMEKARVLMRRIMWNLNDESGGIGWGSPEAMGEILYQSPALAREYQSILFSYLDPRGNFIEHESLQQGVLWGIGTYLGAAPQEMDLITRELLFAHLDSPDPVKRGFAIRALAKAGRLDIQTIPTHLLKDPETIDVFIDWQFVPTPISNMIHLWDGKIKEIPYAEKKM